MRKLWRSHGRHCVEDFARGVEDGHASCPEESNTSRLVGVAHALRSVPLRPGPELTLAFRRRIVNAARAGHHDESRPLLAWLLDGIRVKRGLPSTTVLLTAAVALVSIGFGTTQALPGDTLYGLKLRGEDISIALASSDEARGYGYLRFAGARLRDVSGLIDHDGAWREATVTTAHRAASPHLAGLVNSTLTTMNGYTDKGATSLRRAYQRTHDPAPLAYLDDFTRKQHKTLSGMLGKLPAASQAVAGASLNLVDQLAKETSDLLTEQCTNAGVCQSQARQSDESTSGRPPNATPSEDPATSRTSDITTGGSPDPGPGDGQGTSSQQDSSTSQQPGGTTPAGPGSSGGDTQQSSPPDSSSGSSGGTGSGGGSSTGGTTDSPSTQPSPPPPTGVPSPSSDTSAGTTSTGTDTSGGGTAPAPSSTSGPAGSDDTGNSAGSDDTGNSAGSDDTGNSAGSDDSSGATKGLLPGLPDLPGAPQGQTPSDQPSGDSAAAAPPAP